MAQRITVWHGREKDLAKLRKAVERNCTCDADNPTVPPCPPHQMLSDQSVLDHLAFVGVNRQSYWHGEFDPQAEWW